MLLDGMQWQLVYIMCDLLGGIEMLYFVFCLVCYLCLVSFECIVDWGVLIFELEFFDVCVSVWVVGFFFDEVVVLWQGGGVVVVFVGVVGMYVLVIVLLCVELIIGLVVDWVGVYGVVCLDVCDVQGWWYEIVWDFYVGSCVQSLLVGIVLLMVIVLWFIVEGDVFGVDCFCLFGLVV